MELQFEIALEGGGQLVAEPAVGIEPRDLVFVLVGHQFVGVARHRLGQTFQPRRIRGLGLLHLVDQALAVDSISYLNKPFSISELKHALRRAVKMLEEPIGEFEQPLIRDELELLNDRIFVKNGRGKSSYVVCSMYRDPGKGRLDRGV